jgi:hypothetical protein
MQRKVRREAGVRQKRVPWVGSGSVVRGHGAERPRKSKVAACDRMNTEGGRIATVLAAARECAATEALARARALRVGASPCAGRPCGATPPESAQVLSESSVLDRRVARLLSCGVQTIDGCVSESVRIARHNACVLDAGTPPNRFIPPPCPPAVYNTVVVDATGQVIGLPALGPNQSGNPAVLQGRNCPLPNKPDNPVLPG